MEIEEIMMVLLRASQLNTKINDAIERSVKVDINLNKERFEHGTSSSSCEGGVEARNLISIRDALEALEDQLECFQALQQQQQAEKEAALTDLEESRRELLGKLRDYQGREWEVIHEALAFAGETLDDSDDLPLQPYHKLPSPNTSFSVTDGKSAICYRSTDCSTETASLKQLPWKEEKYELCLSEEESNDSQAGEEVTSNENMQKGNEVPKQNLGIICNSISRFIGTPVGKFITVAAKAGFAAVGLVAVLHLTETGMKKQRMQGITGAHSPLQNSISSPLNEKNQDTDQETFPGKFRNFDYDMEDCFQKEHGDFQSEQEGAVPYVFYGRG